MSYRSFFSLFGLIVSASAIGCASAEHEEGQAWTNDRCDVEGVTCQAFGRKNRSGQGDAAELGTGAKAPTLTVIHQSQPQFDPVDFEFNPRNPRELWISNY